MASTVGTITGKVLFLGRSQVGKTFLISKVANTNDFPRNMSCCVYNYVKKIKNTSVSLKIFDTVDNASFDIAKGIYFHKTDVCVLVFDTSDKFTLAHLSKYMLDIKERVLGNFCILIVGNNKGRNREVKYEGGVKFAELIPNATYMEFTNNDPNSANKIFTKICEQLITLKNNELRSNLKSNNNSIEKKRK